MLKSRKRLSNNQFALLISLPMIIYLCCVLLGPVLWGLSLSFTNKAIGGNATYIGFRNYERLLRDKTFLRALQNTVFYTAGSIAGKTFFGLLMALALNSEFRGRNIARALLIIPWTLPNIVAVLNWRWIFSDTGGILNHLLKAAGFIDSNLVWLGDATLAFLAVLIVNIWRGVPFFGVSILSKLQTIPHDYYEAAEVDGANAWQRFIHVTLPSIKDAVILVMLVSTIWTINEFESVWMLTGGGPNSATEIIGVYSYRTAMTSMQIGRGVAVSVFAMPVLMLLIAVVSRMVLEPSPAKRIKRAGKKA